MANVLTTVALGSTSKFAPVEFSATDVLSEWPGLSWWGKAALDELVLFLDELVLFSVAW